MLVLTRKLGESVTIGDDIKISVIDIKGRQVRLGIEAPPSMTIHREEVYAKIQEENRRAALTEPLNMKKLGDIFPPSSKEEKRGK
ncbi:Carbon storage regulator [hydrothermal vent metagenome]|uniref:Carbon storage regulator n=1 Tax=hydrothermal vent metagenome TaxID=652676 RepID=A0A3B1BQP7_9ZZZZ